MYKEVRSLVTVGSKIEIEHIKGIISAIFIDAADLCGALSHLIFVDVLPGNIHRMSYKHSLLTFELVFLMPVGRSFRNFW